MKLIRLAYRVFAIVIATVIAYCILNIGKLFFFRTPQRKKWRGFITRTWSRMLARIFRMSVTVKGPLPKPPFFLVSNHVSYLDIIALFTQINAIFVAKGELRKWPGMNYVIKSANTIFIDRARKMDVRRVNKLISQAIDNDDSIIVFPEGTSSSGESLMRFKPSLFEYPAKNRFPVSVANIHYRTPQSELPAYLAVCWWGTMPFLPHFMNLLKVPKFEATIYFGSQTAIGENRKSLSEAAQELVSSQFVPIVENIQTDEFGNQLEKPENEVNSDVECDAHVLADRPKMTE